MRGLWVPARSRLVDAVQLYADKYGERLTERELMVRCGAGERTVRRALKSADPLPTFDGRTWLPVPWDVLRSTLPWRARQMAGVLRQRPGCHTSERRLAELLGWPPGQVSRAIAQLNGNGWLYVRQLGYRRPERLVFPPSPKDAAGPGGEPGESTGHSEGKNRPDRGQGPAKLRATTVPLRTVPVRTHSGPPSGAVDNPPADPLVCEWSEALHQHGLFSSTVIRGLVSRQFAATGARPTVVPDLVAWAQGRGVSDPLAYLAAALRTAGPHDLQVLMRRARSAREEREGRVLRRHYEQEEQEERRRREATMTEDPEFFRRLTEHLAAAGSSRASKARAEQDQELERKRQALARLKARLGAP